MDMQAQRKVIEELIVIDEINVASVAAKLSASDKHGNGFRTAKRSLQIEHLKSAQLLLSQGLEGLRLKHDALEELRLKGRAGSSLAAGSGRKSPK